MYKKILLPTDGSERSKGAILHGIALAREAGAEVVGFYAIEPFSVSMFSESVSSDVLPPNHYTEIMHQIAASMLNQIKRAATRESVVCTTIAMEAASPALAIIAAADENHCDLIIMASHGRGNLAGLLLGSQTTRVLSHCKIPVLVYR